MLEKALFFALGYYFGSRQAREGLGELVELAKSLAKSEEFNSAAGMAMSTVRAMADRSGGPATSEGSERAWWEAAV